MIYTFNQIYVIVILYVIADSNISPSLCLYSIIITLLPFFIEMLQYDWL